MAIVYLEELTQKVPNKYLAVNVIAKRARAINDDLLSAGFSKKEKPVSIATEELASGKLTYKMLDPNTSASDIESIFPTESSDTEVEGLDDPIAGLFVESATSESSSDSETESDEEVKFVDEDDEA